MENKSASKAQEHPVSDRNKVSLRPIHAAAALCDLRSAVVSAVVSGFANK